MCIHLGVDSPLAQCCACMLGIVASQPAFGHGRGRLKNGHWQRKATPSRNVPPEGRNTMPILRYHCNLEYCNESRTYSYLLYDDVVVSLTSVHVRRASSPPKILSICTLGFSSCTPSLCSSFRIPALCCTTLTSTRLGHIGYKGIRIGSGAQKVF